jgi:thiol-disulfide isomerase/thioredoxin
MKSILIILLLPLFVYTQEASENRIIISGQVRGDSTSNINLVSESNQDSRLISTSENGSFNDTLFLKDGEYIFVYDQQFFNFSVDRDLTFSLTFDHKNLWSSLDFAGKDAALINYYFEQFLLEMELSEIMYHENINRLDEEEYVQTIDSVTNLKKDIIFRFESELPEEVKEFELGNLKYWRLWSLNNYVHGRRWIRNEPSFNVSINYPDVFANVNYDEEYLYSSNYYISYIKDYLYKKLTEYKQAHPSSNTGVYLLELTKNEVSNPVLLNILFSRYLNQEGKTVEDFEPFFELLKTGITDTLTLIELEKMREQRKKTTKGASVSNFELKNEKGQIVRLSDFKGNLVVVDVWASWCLPCIKEIPKLQEMKNRFKDDSVVFVGINAMDGKDDWLKALQKHSMTGVQLFAPDDQIPFLKDLMVNSLPRYILIDKHGKLLDARLTRPSNEKFYDRIREELE